MMEKLTDMEILEELQQRLEAKDKAYEALMGLTRRLEEVNKKLVESEELKSSFLSNIRNEINNPLTSVLAMSELIISGTEAPDYETLKSIIGLIHRDAFTLNFQMRNIFAAAELEAGEANPALTNADIDSVLRDAVDSLGRRAADKKVKINFEVSPELKEGLFRTDAEKVQRIFSNLLANAIEYSNEGEEVDASAWKEGGRLKLSVRDRGIGIDKCDQLAIFERFRQLDSGLTKSHPGHGLGLSIVKAAVDLLGGSITVESAKGKGALFLVDLPEAEHSSGPEAISTDGTEFFFAESERF